ncbi:MAG: hypothetical protein E6J91_30660 [Deltaproteobacteria bacterium]|nr:MAG: hypothetical protein E6J91_30660 [Deltaproteobacteria bacterium]
MEAERPVLASYPFGTPARPVPASAPPPAELTLSLAERPGLSGDELVDRLRRVAEDGGLVAVIQQSAGKGPISLVVHTTVDGAQRLLGAWRSKALQIAVGVIVGALVLTKGIATAFGATLAASVGQAAGHVGAAVGHIGGAAAAHAGAAVGHIGAAAGHIGAAAGHGGIAAG